jgi:hypothetical protein
MPTYSTVNVHGSAEVVSNALSGTPVALAGPSGRVYAAFTCNKDATASLVGRSSGRYIIPTGSHAQTFSATALENGHRTGDFIYFNTVTPNEELDLEITASAASTSRVTIKVD